MLSNIIPATSFTAATVAPAMLGRLQAVLHWVSSNPVVVAVPLTVAVVLLVAWAFRRDVSRRSPIAPVLPAAKSAYVDQITLVSRAR